MSAGRWACVCACLASGCVRLGVTPSAPTDASAARAAHDGDAASGGGDVGDASAIDGGPPAVEGFGAVTRGAASAPDPVVYRVTSLADDGPGTLRDALSAGRRHVVFDVAGTITLTTRLTVHHSFITVDGSSAPPPGITVVQPQGTALLGESAAGPLHDVLIHHLRMDGAGSNSGRVWQIDGEEQPVSRVGLHHITAVDAPAGAFDIWDDVHDVSIAWNLIADSLAATSFGAGPHVASRISVHHNVFARNNEAQIKLHWGVTAVDYVNNVVYGWGWFEGGASGIWIKYKDDATNVSANVIDSVFHHVEALQGTDDDAVVFERGADEGAVYFTGNVLPAAEIDAVSSAATPLVIPAAARVTTFSAATLGQRVVPHVGTVYPTVAESALLAEIAAALQ